MGCGLGRPLALCLCLVGALEPDAVMIGWKTPRGAGVCRPSGVGPFSTAQEKHAWRSAGGGAM